MIDPALEWATRAGPPNWLFVLALLTSPALWSRSAVRLLRERLGWSA